MPETVLERHYRDRVQSVRQLALREVGRAAFSGRDFKDLVDLCVDLSMSCRQLLENEYHRIFREPDLTVSWLQERRRVIEELSDNYLQLDLSIRTTACHVEQAAGFPSGMDVMSRLDDATRAVAQAKQSVLERWPVGSDDETAQAQAAAARNEGIEVDEAFAQIAGVDVETWRRRVEEYKGHPEE